MTITTIVLLILLAWLLAQWTWLFLRPKEVVAPPAATPPINVNAVAERIISTHIFGVAGEKGNADDAQVSTLNLHLKGVFAFSEDTPAFAIVNTGAKSDDAFKVGDEIVPGVLLTEVQATNILIKRSGVLEKVNLEETPGGTGVEPPRVPPPRTSNARPVAPTTSRPSRSSAPSSAPNNYNLSRSELTATLQDPKQLSSLGKVNSNAGGGVVVEDVPSNSLAERLGLQPGDIIRTINGGAVNSPGDLGRIYQHIGQTAQLRVDGMRGGQPLNLTYNMQQ
ncbi:MAG: type II secretion system protein N [Pseudomonadota bacterium]